MAWQCSIKVFPDRGRPCSTAPHPPLGAVAPLGADRFQKCDLAGTDPIAARRVELSGRPYVDHGLGERRQGECRLFVKVGRSMRGGNFDCQQSRQTALQRSKEPARWGGEDMPAIERVSIDGRDSERHLAAIGGDRAPAATFAGRAHCLVEGIGVGVGPEHAHSGLEHVRVQVIRKLVSTHCVSQVARADRTAGWTASLYPILYNAELWHFAAILVGHIGTAFGEPASVFAEAIHGQPQPASAMEKLKWERSKIFNKRAIRF